jgi:hypothetical protein
MSEQDASKGQWSTEPERPPPSIKIGKWSVPVHTVIRGFLVLGVGFLVTKASESLLGPEALNGLYAAQASWIDTVNHMNPFALIGNYISDTGRAFQGEVGSDGSFHGASYFSPLVGLYVLISDLFNQGAFFTLLQVGLGALAIGALNMASSGGKRIFFGELHEDGRFLQNLLFWPLAVVAAASVLAFVLQLVMLSALYLFSWVTGLAALAAGATGAGSFCWYCVTKLGEKGVEHVITTKL